MKYRKFFITNYRAISKTMCIDLTNKRLMPIVGVNECGKTTILKAIFCFDESNDKLYSGKHLTSLDNLYSTKTDEIHLVSAEIETTKKELIETLYKAKDKLQLDDVDSESFDSIEIDDNKFQITRDLDNKKYNIEILDFLSSENENKIAKYIIQNKLPCILYNDDFNDRPPAIINIPQEGVEGDEWFDIYQRVFNAAGQDIFEVIETENPQKRKTILKSVEKILNKSLMESWNKFKLTKTVGSINIFLELREQTRELVISIEETINKENYYFEIDDRSKGFIWYYNFIMKTKYNGKSDEDEKNMIYLLDEPGSYLHFAAQDQLCEKIKEISKNNAIVIYCTHSHHMLNLKHIPLNTMYIVEKSKKSIVLQKATQIATVTNKQNALQPIYEAIGIPLFDKYFADDKILMVEGIYDKYSIELFCNIPDEVNIFASTSCNDMIKNIPYFMLYNKKYIALWDNDSAGINSLKEATKNYGLVEANKFKLLPPIKQEGDRRMEEMYTEGDIKSLATLLKLDVDSDYETVMATLYTANPTVIKKAKSILDKTTIDSFRKLSQLVIKSFERNYSIEAIEEVEMH